MALVYAIYALLFGVLSGNLAYLRRQQLRTHDITTGEYPRLSVLIPARNEETNLERLLPTLLAQDYPDLQIIVVDDASDDGTWRVLSSFRDDRLVSIRSSGPPPGWMGKVHALHTAAAYADGDVLLFLDADTQLRHERALVSMTDRFRRLPSDAVLTGITSHQGGGNLLVSLVPHAILVALPWFLVRRGPATLGGLNGQCWMISSADYRRLEPHRACRGEILEDVMIGRFLSRNGLVPTVVDAQRDVAVYMYADLREAWHGFRKNAYLIMGGSAIPYLASLAAYAAVYIIGPALSWKLLVAMYVLKTITDRRTGFPLWVSALAPVSFLLGSAMQVDSALAHWRGRVSWKGRAVRRGGSMADSPSSVNSESP